MIRWLSLLFELKPLLSLLLKRNLQFRKLLLIKEDRFDIDLIKHLPHNTQLEFLHRLKCNYILMSLTDNQYYILHHLISHHHKSHYLFSVHLHRLENMLSFLNYIQILLLPDIFQNNRLLLLSLNHHIIHLKAQQSHFHRQSSKHNCWETHYNSKFIRFNNLKSTRLHQHH